jgi:phenylacetaldehyde dehydrogenase
MRRARKDNKPWRDPVNAQTPIENRMEAFRARWTGKVGKMLIGGEWREAASGETFATEDPSTGEKLADIASAGQADVDAAVAAARGAFEGSWAKVRPSAQG